MLVWVFYFLGVFLLCFLLFPFCGFFNVFLCVFSFLFCHVFLFYVLCVLPGLSPFVFSVFLTLSLFFAFLGFLFSFVCFVFAFLFNFYCFVFSFCLFLF